MLAIGFVILVLIILIGAAGYIWFNRFPKFVTADSSDKPSNIIVSPAYGKVVAINETDKETEIVIYLTIFDVHYQFYPIDGKIIDTQYDTTGKFELVSHGTDKSRMNEKQITQLQTSQWGVITLKQIAGFFVRRIDFYNSAGDEIKRGDTMGKIHFGSRVDIILPKPVTLKIKNGQYLYGPDTIIGEFCQNC